MKELYPHQKEFVEEIYPNKKILAFGTGVGKTITAIHTANKYAHNGKVFILCPKHVKDKWADDLDSESNSSIYVIDHYEHFRKEQPGIDFDFMIIDEGHRASASPLTRQGSQISKAVWNFIKARPSMKVLVLSATPVTANPYSLHTLMSYTGDYVDFKVWRNYFCEKRTPVYSKFPIWLPKQNWRKLMIKTYNRRVHVKTMADVVKDMPEIIWETVNVKVPPLDSEQAQEWSAPKAFNEKRKHENMFNDIKLKAIMDIIESEPKVAIVCHYTEQIDDYAKKISNDRTVFILDGRTKDKEELIRQANESLDAVLIINSAVSDGYELPTFPIMIFASTNYSYNHYSQMQGRILRINKLHDIKYVIVNGGKHDKRVQEILKEGRSFDENKDCVF